MSSVPFDGGLDIEESDLDALFDGGVEVEEEPEAPEGGLSGVGASSELMAVTHRIAAQFVDVIAMAAGQVLAGRSPAVALDQLEHAITALRRLARAAADAQHHALLDELSEAIATYRHDLERDVGHAAFRDLLRSWLPRYAEFVGGATGDRLARLVEFDPDDVPLFRHLVAIRGIGPRRLQRLYAAGLYDAEILKAADPEDVAAVTGLPRKLAGEVVAQTRAHAEAHKEKVVRDMPRRLHEFIEVVQELDGNHQGEVVDVARQALLDLRQILDQLLLQEA